MNDIEFDDDYGSVVHREITMVELVLNTFRWWLRGILLGGFLVIATSIILGFLN